MLLEVAGKKLDIFENLDERYVESIITLAHVLSKISNSYNWVYIEFIYNICDVLRHCYHMYKREKPQEGVILLVKWPFKKGVFHDF